MSYGKQDWLCSDTVVSNDSAMAKEQNKERKSVCACTRVCVRVYTSSVTE